MTRVCICCTAGARCIWPTKTWISLLISLRRNMGFAMACNIGVQAAETPLVCLMNSDVMPIDPGWIDPLHQQIEMHPEQLLAPLLVYDSGLIQHAGMTTNVQDNGCSVPQQIFTPSRDWLSRSWSNITLNRSLCV